MKPEHVGLFKFSQHLLFFLTPRTTTKKKTILADVTKEPPQYHDDQKPDLDFG
jgi:hypothetical protein